MGGTNQDRCFGLSVDTTTGYVTSLLQVKAKEIRSSSLSRGDFYDTVLLRMDTTGKVDFSVQITNRDSAINMYSSSNGLFSHDGYFYFGGWSAGFHTTMQTYTYTTAASNQDAYLYKYKFQHATSFDCLYENDIADSVWSATAFSLLYPESTFYQSGTRMTFYSSRTDLRVTQTQQSYFTPYSSKYSGGFDLLDSMIIPRPCAFKSSNLTSVDYYRGQKSQQYKISQQNSQGFVITMMDESSVLIYQNGKSASDIATYDKDTYSVYIQTDSEDKVGTQKVIIRNCDDLDRLLELNLYIAVLTNTHPDFTSEVETSFTMSVGETFTYKLPTWSDAESND